MKNTSLADLRATMFDVMQRLMSANDPDADEKDRIDVDTAKAMANIGTVIVNSAKIESDALRTIANAQNPNLLKSFLINSEIIKLNDSDLKLLQ